MKYAIEDYFKGNYQAFYSKYLTKVKKIGGDEYQASCPFHKDENPSFNFNNEGGKYYCHGCGKKGHIAHFYGKLNGLDTKRDFPKILKGIANDFGISWEENKPRLVKTYDYTDSEGNLLYQVCRYEPKTFKQRHPNGNGGWTWNLKGVQRVLYNLPQVLKANEVFIVEGEQDVNTLTELGLTATTCPMGAKKWLPEYNEALRGKDVVLIPDSDIEGLEHAAMVGTSLSGLVNSIKLVELPVLPSKGDVSDWIITFDDKMEAAEKLSILVENAGPYTPPKKATIEDAIFTAKDFTALDIPSKKIFLNPWLTEQSITLISGWRGTGKTWLALSILDAVNKGGPFGPWEASEPMPCLFLDAEMPAQDVVERTKELRIQSVFIYSDSYANSLGLPKASLLAETWRTSMKRVLLTRKIKLWVIDNIGSVAGGIDENIKRDWDPVNQWLLELRFAGIATIMLHHVGKEGGQRGTSAREDNIDNSIILKRPSDYMPDDGCRFILHFTKDRVRTQDLNKIADIEFQLRQDEAGKLIWTHSDVKKEIKKVVLKMLDEGIDYKSICETLDITKGYISRIKKQAITDGLLSTKSQLTPSGLQVTQGYEI